MVKTKTIEASKISPSFMIGNSLSVISRDLKRVKSPPKFSNDYNCRFYEYKAIDNSKVTLIKDYDDKICTDFLSYNYLNEMDLSNSVTLKDLVLTRKNDELSGTKIIIHTSQKSINKETINLTGRHKAQQTKLSSLTVCYPELEQSVILQSNLLPDYRKARKNQIPNKDGKLIINY